MGTREERRASEHNWRKWDSKAIKFKRLAVALVAAAAVSTGPTGAANAQVPEIAYPGLPDIAMVQVVNGQVVILYNPVTCAAAGPALCGFYRAHEYGHVALGHVALGTFPPQAEAEADCWAARAAGQAEVQAALAYFSSGGGGDLTHGSGPERAQRLLACRR